MQAFRSVPGCQTCMCKRGIWLTIMWNQTVQTVFTTAALIQTYYYYLDQFLFKSFAKHLWTGCSDCL